ncbi:MAG TPA: NAD(P)H-dependent oxidoreductase, partial [Acidiferrobacteraceae bacterium]|nr:NAD(P)H-dependent oxidoreductase [Acidiferrobacteraceae bacterium]
AEIEQLAAGRVAPAVAEAHAALQSASGLVLVYPVWWGGPPAILSGWLQRVLIEGFAYRYEDRARGLLALPAQLILNAGTQDRSLQALYSEPVQSVLRYCGCTPVECHINWGIYPGAPPERAEAACREAYAAGARFGQRLSIAPEF